MKTIGTKFPFKHKRRDQLVYGLINISINSSFTIHRNLHIFHMGFSSSNHTLLNLIWFSFFCFLLTLLSGVFLICLKFMGIRCHLSQDRQQYNRNIYYSFHPYIPSIFEGNLFVLIRSDSKQFCFN